MGGLPFRQAQNLQQAINQLFTSLLLVLEGRYKHCLTVFVELERQYWDKNLTQVHILMVIDLMHVMSSPQIHHQAPFV